MSALIAQVLEYPGTDAFGPSGGAQDSDVTGLCFACLHASPAAISSGLATGRHSSMTSGVRSRCLRTFPDLCRGALSVISRILPRFPRASSDVPHEVGGVERAVGTHQPGAVTGHGAVRHDADPAAGSPRHRPGPRAPRSRNRPCQR